MSRVKKTIFEKVLPDGFLIVDNGDRTITITGDFDRKELNTLFSLPFFKKEFVRKENKMILTLIPSLPTRLLEQMATDPAESSDHDPHNIEKIIEGVQTLTHLPPASAEASIVIIENLSQMEENFKKLLLEIMLIIDLEFSSVHLGQVASVMQIYLPSSNEVLVINTIASDDLYGFLLENLPILLSTIPSIMFGIDADVIVLKRCFGISDFSMIIDFQEVVKAFNKTAVEKLPIGLKKLFGVMGTVSEEDIDHKRAVWTFPLSAEQIAYAVKDVVGLFTCVRWFRNEITIDDSFIEEGYISTQKKCSRPVKKKPKKVTKLLSLRFAKTFCPKEDVGEDELLNKFLGNLFTFIVGETSAKGVNLMWIATTRQQKHFIASYVVDLYKRLLLIPDLDLESMTISEYEKLCISDSKVGVPMFMHDGFGIDLSKFFNEDPELV